MLNRESSVVSGRYLALEIPKERLVVDILRLTAYHSHTMLFCDGVLYGITNGIPEALTYMTITEVVRIPASSKYDSMYEAMCGIKKLDEGKRHAVRIS